MVARSESKGGSLNSIWFYKGSLAELPGPQGVELAAGHSQRKQKREESLYRKGIQGSGPTAMEGFVAGPIRQESSDLPRSEGYWGGQRDGRGETRNAENGKRFMLYVSFINGRHPNAQSIESEALRAGPVRTATV